MTRRIKRNANYEISLEIIDPEFLPTPRESQKNWIMNRLLKEADDELQYLNSIAGNLISGSDEAIDFDREQANLADQDIMEDWQIPVMEKMANIAAKSGGDILEIGMGRAIASDFIQKHKPLSHTIVECNDTIAAGFSDWSSNYPESSVHLLHGKWQDKISQLDKYDGILFHTYPLNEDEFVENVVHASTFSEHFFDTASRVLKPGGSFTYLTNENDSLSRMHQRKLLSEFSEIRLSQIHDLDIPDETRDSLWLNELLLVEIIK